MVYKKFGHLVICLLPYLQQILFDRIRGRSDLGLTFLSFFPHLLQRVLLSRVEPFTFRAKELLCKPSNLVFETFIPSIAEYVKVLSVEIGNVELTQHASQSVKTFTHQRQEE